MGNIMSFELINKVNQAQKKQAVVDARSGDTVRVYQKIKEGNKERIQMFEGVVIRTDNILATQPADREGGNRPPCQGSSQVP